MFTYIYMWFWWRPTAIWHSYALNNSVEHTVALKYIQTMLCANFSSGLGDVTTRRHNTCICLSVVLCSASRVGNNWVKLVGKHFQLPNSNGEIQISICRCDLWLWGFIATQFFFYNWKSCTLKKFSCTSCKRFLGFLKYWK